MARPMMWFGTLNRMRWVPVPLRGADMSPEAWGSSGVLLSGGGYVDSSVGSHKQYVFEWSSTSSIEAAQVMKSYRDGTFGRGLLYFIDPLIYNKNLFPAHWADPSMGVDNGARTLVVGTHPTSTPTNAVDSELYDLPINSAVYDLTNTDDGYRGEYESIFIPIPPTMTLLLGSQHSVTGSGAILVAVAEADGTVGTPVALPPMGTNSPAMINSYVTGEHGVRIWVGKTAPGAASVTIAAMTARMVETARIESYIDGVAWVDNGDGTWTFTGEMTDNGDGTWTSSDPLDNGDGTWTSTIVPNVFVRGPWIGGMGHSGTKFAGPPTYIANGPHDGGQIGFAATFKEVGSWL